LQPCGSIWSTESPIVKSLLMKASSRLIEVQRRPSRAWSGGRRGRPSPLPSSPFRGHNTCLSAATLPAEPFRRRCSWLFHRCPAGQSG
jgi:hypothetical protein